jgi:adenylate cyclase 10
MELLAEEEENRKRLTILNHRGSSHEKIIEELKRIRKNLQLKRNHYGIYTISRSSTQTLTNEQLKIVATFIPDEILEHPNDTKIRKFECALFFADVSGYTDLSTKYQYVENGASKLSNVMNTYLGSMVQEIFAHKGDILKYAGDAFIAIFKVGNEISMQECVRRAIDTALIIQKNSSFRTEVGVELSVKITISAGEVLFSVVGDSNSSYYVIIGDPIWDSKAMQSKIKAGEILVNSRTWLFANDSLYRFKFLREHQIYKVLSFRDNMIEVLQRQHETLLYFNEQSKKAVDESEMSSKSMTEMTSTVYDRSYERIALAEMTQKKSLFKVRSNIDISLENRSRKFLRRFLLKPLMKLIDSGEAIETLLEMRRVVVVFANFVVNYKSAEDLIDITQRIYTTLTRIVTDFEGTDNKITLFDKDMMFVAIFGLRGMKHEREARVALRCAAAIHQTFQSWQNEIRTVSLGISTGNCFCGFVGHTLRREFSVISVTVNTAARLMMAYPNIVSCDQETVFDSKLLFRHFERLPKKAMKGLNDKVLAFKFIDWKITDEMNSLNLFKERKFSFVGRKNDLKLAIDFIQEQNSSDECCLLIQGENEDGKTRLLIEISDFSKLNGIRCIFIPLFLQHRRKQFHTLRRVICKILEVNEENLTTRINEMLEITPSENDFWMLNSVLDTTFSVPKNPTNEDTFNSGGNIFEEFRKFIEFIVVEKITILIDDLELVDKSSLDYLHTIFHNEKTSCVLTLGNHRSVKERFLEILGQRHVKRCQLEPLSLDEQNSLAFQFLDVVELSKDLQEFIHNNSKGNPGWILTSLNWFQELNQIEILSSEKSGSIAKFKSSENVDEISKRLLTPNNDNDLMIFDKLPTFEQFVCKCAAVLGNEFPRKKLAFLLSKGSERQLGKAIVRLFENQIFTCGSAIPTSTERVSTNTCHCEQLTISDACRDLPITSSCSMLKFQKPSFREIVYQLLGEKQRIEFHEKALVFLHLNTRKCKSCGYEPFAFVWEQETDFKFHDGTLHNKKDKSLTDMIDYFDSLCLPISKDSKTRKSKWNCSANSMEVLPIILNYAAYNFNDCECYSILSKMYKEMINHCHGGKNFLKLIDTKIKFARMVLVRSNYENVDEPNKLLTRALHQLEVNELKC